MKSKLLSVTLLLIMLLPYNAFSLHVWVFFTDKGPDTSDFMMRASQSLTDKALARREKLGIKPDFSDITLYQPYIYSLDQDVCRFLGGAKWINAA
jgi:hypothetical protein